MAKGIVGYEASQEVTKAFRSLSHEFYSCDKEKPYGGHPEWHIHDDIYSVFKLGSRPDRWNFVGLHPVCRLLCNSGIRWLTSKKSKPGYFFNVKYGVWVNPDRWHLMELAAAEFKQCLLWVAEAGKGYVENPIMHPYAAEIIGMRPTQIIQPYMFGHTTQKATCLWIFGLPKLTPTSVIPKELRTHEIHKCAPGPDRERIRSKTFPGIAKAMADQWGKLI